ncbi:Aromatic/aminoadipate aminotransferase 1 [Ascosphaera atra]|nr:Aromatic/aminoadipate aminotransferase 1 [Ascosphaera atra]
MFEWIKVDWKKHPAAKEGKSNAEVEAQIFKAAVEAGALVALGSWFQTDRNASEDGMYFRVTFASAPHEKIEEAIHRLGTALKKQFQLA